MTQPAFVGGALATPNFSTTISKAISGILALNTLIVAYSYGPQLMSSVAAAGTTGNITFTALASAPTAGSIINVNGAAGGTGSIVGYSNPTNYLVAASPAPTTTSCTLLTLASGAVTTTVGTLTMQFPILGAPTITDSVNGTLTPFFGPTGSSGSNFGGWCMAAITGVTAGARTITCSNASGFNSTQNALIMWYSGGAIDTAPALMNGTFIAGGTGTNTGASGSLTPSQANCTVVGFAWATDSSNALGAGTNIAWTSEFNTPAYWMVQDIAQTTAVAANSEYQLTGGNANENIQSGIFALQSFGGPSTGPLALPRFGGPGPIALAPLGWVIRRRQKLARERNLRQWKQAASGLIVPEYKKAA
jgi:hypothetical protein